MDDFQSIRPHSLDVIGHPDRGIMDLVFTDGDQHIRVAMTTDLWWILFLKLQKKLIEP